MKRAALFLVAVAVIASAFFVIHSDYSPDTDADPLPVAEISGTYYYTLEEALDASVSGNTVIVLADCWLSSNASVKGGVTLIIPYSSADRNGHALGDTDNSKTSAKIASNDRLYLTVTVSSGKTLDVQGSLIVGGVTGRFFTFDYQGHTSGGFSVLQLNGTVNVQSGGVLKSYGFIKGNGHLNALAGSSVYEPFVITDFVGGDNAYNLFNAGQAPFNRYAVMNIQCTMKVNSGASLFGYVNLFANGGYNECTVTFIGGGSSLIHVQNGGSVTMTYNPNRYAEGNWESNIYGDIGKTNVSISGGASFGSIVLSFGGNTMNSKDCVFSFPYNIDITLDSGNYSADCQYRILPGSTLTVNNGASLDVKGKLYVFDGLEDIKFRDKYYPTTSQLKSKGFPINGRLIVNGTLNIVSGGTLAGTVESGRIGASIAVSSGANVEPVSVSYGCVNRASGSSAPTITETARTLSGIVFDESGNIIQLEKGKNYESISIGSTAVSGYSYTDVHEGKDHTVNSSYAFSGKWKDAADIPGDGDGDEEGDGDGDTEVPTEVPDEPDEEQLTGIMAKIAEAVKNNEDAVVIDAAGSGLSLPADVVKALEKNSLALILKTDAGEIEIGADIIRTRAGSDSPINIILRLVYPAELGVGQTDAADGGSVFLVTVTAGTSSLDGVLVRVHYEPEDIGKAKMFAMDADGNTSSVDYVFEDGWAKFTLGKEQFYVISESSDNGGSGVLVWVGVAAIIAIVAVGTVVFLIRGRHA
jgi:hypothetical protein